MSFPEIPTAANPWILPRTLKDSHNELNRFQIVPMPRRLRAAHLNLKFLPSELNHVAGINLLPALGFHRAIQFHLTIADRRLGFAAVRRQTFELQNFVKL